MSLTNATESNITRGSRFQSSPLIKDFLNSGYHKRKAKYALSAGHLGIPHTRKQFFIEKRALYFPSFAKSKGWEIGVLYLHCTVSVTVVETVIVESAVSVPATVNV